MFPWFRLKSGTGTATNVLSVLNRELGADFDLSHYAHYALFDPVASQIEMHLVAMAPQRVRFAAHDRVLDLAEGDSLRTEISRKFTAAALEDLLRGAGFAIERHYAAQGFKFDMPHIDLMWPARALGLSGGLKDMEKQLGIARERELADIRGNEAIVLWGKWKNGDRAAYERLVGYCKADCRNLRAFADAVYERTWAKVHTPYAKQIDLDASRGEQLSLF